MSTAFDTTTLFKSLVAFLVTKGFLNASDAPEGAFTPKAEQAYKSYAEHKCGVPHPQPIPANLSQVPAQILADGDWVYDSEVVVPQQAQETTQTLDEVVEPSPAPDASVELASTPQEVAAQVEEPQVVVQENDTPAADLANEVASDFEGTPDAGVDDLV